MPGPLRLYSEPYAASGAMSASGIGRLLGAPNSDRLQVVIRESIQNSWDARASEGSAEWRIRVFSPTRHQISALASQVFAARSSAADVSGNEVAECLASRPLRLLEISDFGTIGLGGPTRSDQVPDIGQRTDYVDFVLNVGRQRDRELGGGTYGYGKSSFFALSECSTIVIHTVTIGESGRNEHRLIASRLGPNFDVRRGTRRGRFTGRHWWGDPGSDLHGVLPLRGAAARRMAAAIGMTERSEDDAGTSILVLAPMFPSREDDDSQPLEGDQLAAHIVQSILWNAWPKLVPKSNRRKPPMRLSASIDGVPVPVPAPLAVSPYDKLSEALMAVRAGEGNQIVRYQELLGTVAFRIWPRTRPSSERNTLSLVPEPLHHVILMRPAELVVEALEGPEHLDPDVEWAGVFMCSEEPEIEESFAESEPPAHDSWNPDNLREKVQKSRVTVALRRIRESARAFVAPKTCSTVVGHGSLAPAATLLGRDLMGLTGTGPGIRPKGKKPGKSSAATRQRISRPVFVGLESGPDGPWARFECEVELPANVSRHLLAVPFVVSDSGSEDLAPNGRKPELVGWCVDGGEMDGSRQLPIQGPVEQKIQVVVSVPDYVAISVAVTFATDGTGGA